ncbi:hypothetical protein FQR65_LT15189 [Abscondita terminalis]|nr:hypothetical protein FQR65_LT15189 [Abscondita terminalis]
MNASLLSLINSISLQRTNGNVSTPVGTEYSVGYLLDLLGIGGGGQQELTVILPVVGSAQANDGIRMKKMLSSNPASYIDPLSAGRNAPSPTTSYQMGLMHDGLNGNWNEYYTKNGLPCSANGPGGLAEYRRTG